MLCDVIVSIVRTIHAVLRDNLKLYLTFSREISHLDVAFKLTAQEHIQERYIAGLALMIY